MPTRTNPVTAQEANDRLDWLVTTHIVTDTNRHLSAQPLPPLQGPPREPRTPSQELLAYLPRPAASDVLAVLRDFPIATERGREHGYADADALTTNGTAHPTDDGTLWFTMDTTELRAHFTPDTVIDVATCYKRGWLQGWNEYCEQNS